MAIVMQFCGNITVDKLILNKGQIITENDVVIGKYTKFKDNNGMDVFKDISKKVKKRGRNYFNIF